MNKIKAMFDLQQQLNDNTNGNLWIDGTTKEGRDINWNRCIYMEAIEALDSFNWKHWKDINSKDNWDNLLVELVDIWHFLMSEAISLKQTQIKPQVIPHKDKNKLIKQLELLAKIGLDNSLNPNNRTQNIKVLIEIFFQTIACANMNIDELYQRYVVKNQLNIFRQNHGYKDGTYQKIWAGKEDNIVAFSLMKEKVLSPDELYQALEDIYRD